MWLYSTRLIVNLDKKKINFFIGVLKNFKHFLRQKKIIICLNSVLHDENKPSHDFEKKIYREDIFFPPSYALLFFRLMNPYGLHRYQDNPPDISCSYSRCNLRFHLGRFHKIFFFFLLFAGSSIKFQLMKVIMTFPPGIFHSRRGVRRSEPARVWWFLMKDFRRWRWGEIFLSNSRFTILFSKNFLTLQTWWK